MLTQLEDRAVPATISGTAFADSNSNGTRDTGEGAIANVVVTATQQATESTFTATSDATGHYEIDGLTYGPWDVTIAPPPGDWVATPSTGTASYYFSDPDNDSAQLDIGLGVPAVSVAVVNDGVEDGTDGTLEFTRSGDTTAGLSVTYTVTGTATPGADYTALSGAVSFAPGSSTADVPVPALKDTLEEDDETVITTITGDGTAYTGVGSSATLTVIDTTLLPVALDFWNTTDENTPATVTPLGAVINLDSDALTVSAVGDAGHGTVAINADGSVTYTPDTGYVGDDSFTYTVAYATGTTTATISYTVEGLMAPPFSVWTAPGTAVNIDAAGAAYDPSGGTPTVAAVGSASHGLVAINADGTIGYTPAGGFTGDDSFSYTAEDAAGNQRSNTITVTVAASAPVALDADTATDQDSSVTVSVLDSAFNLAGGTLSVASVTPGANGTVAINADGTVTYTPAAGYTGPDSFQYTVTDGNGHTATGTINLTVGPPPAGPTDEIDSDLAGIQTDLDDFDPDAPDPDETAAAIQSVVDGILGAVDNYLNDTTQFINTANIDTAGSNLPLSDFLRTPVFLYQQLQQRTNTLVAMQWAISHAMSANKSLMESLYGVWESLKLDPNPADGKIDPIMKSISTLMRLQWSLDSAFVATHKAVVKSDAESMKAYLALLTAWSRLPHPTYFLLGHVLGTPPATPVQPPRDGYIPSFVP